MRLRLTLIAFSFLILLEACNSKGKTENSNVKAIEFSIPQTAKSPSDLVVYESATSIYGEWFNTNPNNSVRLILNTDSSFCYINEGSSTDTITGKWTLNHGDYILHELSMAGKNETTNNKDGKPFFEIKFRFTNGFIYELRKEGALSADYFVQSKSYR